MFWLHKGQAMGVQVVKNLPLSRVDKSLISRQSDFRLSS